MAHAGFRRVPEDQAEPEAIPPIAEVIRHPLTIMDGERQAATISATPAGVEIRADLLEVVAVHRGIPVHGCEHRVVGPEPLDIAVHVRDVNVAAIDLAQRSGVITQQHLRRLGRRGAEEHHVRRFLPLAGIALECGVERTRVRNAHSGQRSHELGTLCGQRPTHHSTPVVPDDVGTVPAQRRDDGRGVVDEVGQLVVRDALRPSASPKARYVHRCEGLATRLRSTTRSCGLSSIIIPIFYI